MHRGNNMFSIRRKIQKQVSPFHCVASDPLASSLYLIKNMVVAVPITEDFINVSFFTIYYA